MLSNSPDYSRLIEVTQPDWNLGRYTTIPWHTWCIAKRDTRQYLNTVSWFELEFTVTSEWPAGFHLIAIHYYLSTNSAERSAATRHCLAPRTRIGGNKIGAAEQWLPNTLDLAKFSSFNFALVLMVQCVTAMWHGASSGTDVSRDD